MRKLKFTHSFEVVRDLQPELQPLHELASNFWWCWHDPSASLFAEVDPDLWAAVEHNPVQLLNDLPRKRQLSLVEDEVFMARLGLCVREFRQYMADETWFSKAYPQEASEMKVAYFCAEFGVHESLPIYSGGLGILAGDHLKAASDLGIPLVGVGLLYSRGYFRQVLSPDAWQTERYAQNDFHELPIKLVRDADNEPLRVPVDLPDGQVSCQIWHAKIGRVDLYLLDSNILENTPLDQGITDTLYGGDQEMRIRQEMILGIGGFRALERLGRVPSVCHMNEGHAAFLCLERIRDFMRERGCELRTARQCTVAGNIFTTHTPVPAGFDKFEFPMLEKYLNPTVRQIGMPFDYFVKMGKVRPEDPNETFNMAVLAMSNANTVNGVSKLHAQVTREMFSDRWPDYTVEEIPIRSITNGIHTPSWISRRMSELLARHVHPDWREELDSPEMWAKARDIPDHELWEMREAQRDEFVRWCRKRVRGMLRRSNASSLDLATVSEVLDPRVLTVGFARRFATYKRANLLLSDRERLMRLLEHPERPVQFVFAGKAHPRDDEGKRLIQEIVQFIRQGGARRRMVFLEDYDIEIARRLVQGVDLWLNNPRRPEEASGTSGMKVVVNGGLNVSVLDGWWAEAYESEVGWAIGDGAVQPDQSYQDWLDSRAIYHLLENEIGPRFYQRNDSGVPRGWLEVMRASMANLAPVFNTCRMVKEYTESAYLPAHRAFTRLAEGDLGRAKTALAWREKVQKAWPEVKILSVSDQSDSENAIGQSFDVEVNLALGALEPSDVRVEVLVGGVGANRELRHMDTIILDHVPNTTSPAVFRGPIRCDTAGHMGYAVRVSPHHEDVNVPNELALVRWEVDSPMARQA